VVRLIASEDALGLEQPKSIFNAAACVVANGVCVNCSGKGSGVYGPCPQNKAGGIVSRVGAKLDAIADRVPGVKQVKDGVKSLMTGIHSRLASRYGDKAATVIMTSGAAGGYGVAAVAFAVTGIPGIPVVNDLVSIAAHTAVAEVVLQLGRLKRRLLGNDDHLAGIDVEAVREQVVAALRAEFVALLAEHGPGMVGVSEAEVEDLKRSLVGEPTVNQRWRFLSDPVKVEQFKRWLEGQLADLLTGRTEEELWQRFVEEGLAKGAGRAFDDAHTAERGRALASALGESGQRAKLDFYDGTKEEFLRSSFNQPVAVDKVKLLAARAFDDLEGVTSQMGRAMTRALTQGLVRGESPREIARAVVVPVDSYKNRALAIARTEIIRAHAEGQLMALEQMGVAEVGVMVEWSTSGMGLTALGNPSPCPKCEEHAGEVMSLEDARGRIPYHPNCMCSWIPALPKALTRNLPEG